MNYFKLGNEVFAFESDGSQDDYISDEMIPMSNDEIDRHIHPEKYLSAEEKLRIAHESMPKLTPTEFDIKLVDAGLYEKVQALIQSDIKLKIAYTRATFFSRTDSFINQVRIALGLTDAQVDTIWLQQEQSK